MKMASHIAGKIPPVSSRPPDTPSPALGVYVHWPFCTRICPYCDFNVYKNRSLDERAWIEAMKVDLKFWHRQSLKTDNTRKLTSLYFGGGTPSLASLDILKSVIDLCENLWGFETGAEITLEGNPIDIESTHCHQWAEIGINRLSLGVQSFDDQALKFLGRDHDGASARTAIQTASMHFENVTFDLIYGLPEQTLSQWRHQLHSALSLNTSHLSLYQLTIESGTAFAKAKTRGTLVMPDEQTLGDFYEYAVEDMTAAGFDHYEISNFAKSQAQAKHNRLYWDYQDYIGIGPGAHGRLTQAGRKTATLAHFHPRDYLAACKAVHHGCREMMFLTPQQTMQERFSLGLRLKSGIPLKSDDYYFQSPERASRLKQCQNDGLVLWQDEKLIATPRGRQLLDSVLLALGL